MAFKMKGHKLPGPYQQKKEIDASAPEYNQPVDNENTQRVMNMRANQLGKAETDRDTYVSDVNTYAEKHGLSEDQHAKATEKLGKKQKAYDMKLDAHNFSADSANTAIANQNKRIADAAAAAKKDEGSLFKQKETHPENQKYGPTSRTKKASAERSKKKMEKEYTDRGGKFTGKGGGLKETDLKKLSKKGGKFNKSDLKSPAKMKKKSPAKMKKKSPMKVAPIVAQLAPKVIGAVAGNMMDKKGE